MFLAGVALAVIMALVTIPYAALILAVLGLAVGFLNIGSGESQGFLISAIALMMTAASLGVIPAVGEWLDAIATTPGPRPPSERRRCRYRGSV